MTHKLAVITLAVLQIGLTAVPPAFAQNRYSRDGTSCDLNGAETLTDICGAARGLPTGGTQQQLINRNPNISSMIVDAANEYGVSPGLALAVSGHEGRMSACAGSPTGVQGPMQLTQATGRGYGMDRNILSQNIRGGMLTLRDAIRSCGGESDIRCLADRYNGSTEAQRQSWTNGVTDRLAQMNNTPLPPTCDQRNSACRDSDFPLPGQTSVAAATPPPPASSDINVAAGQV